MNANFDYYSDAPRIRRGAGRPDKYPWAEWTDGGVWEARQGFEFTCSPANFASALYKRKYRDASIIDVHINVEGDTGVVYFQFIR
jgi:hypothetical protein